MLVSIKKMDYPFAGKYLDHNYLHMVTTFPNSISNKPGLEYCPLFFEHLYCDLCQVLHHFAGTESL